ncbi:MAG TPA: transposase, partial [Levilinea sp.]|nr:transposase [Levilinea sp.]
MPPKRPRYLPGQYYHFFNRGCNGNSIFKENENYLFVLGKIKQYATEYDLTVIAYCLMPNHYHLLIRQNGELAAGLLIQRVFNSYTKAYNKRYQRSGTLFEDNYHVRSVDRTKYLLQLCRYIHFNPVKDGIVKHPEDWPYSNYLEWVGLRNGTLFDPGFVRDNFSGADDYRA